MAICNHTTQVKHVLYKSLVDYMHKQGTVTHVYFTIYGLAQWIFVVMVGRFWMQLIIDLIVANTKEFP